MLRLRSPAKLNLFLHIIGRRQDGYHNLQTVFQFIDLCDEMLFEATADGNIVLETPIPNVINDDNLIIKAARLLQYHAGVEQGAKIAIEKKIPMGGGLGGGSSNAATTLLALCRLWDLDFNLSTLAELGLKLGADVPVFVHGEAAWAEGVGEKLTPMILPERWYVLLIPDCAVSTAQLFQDPRLTRDSEAMTIDHYRFGAGHNDFEPILRMDFPQIARALDWLSQFSPTKVTGSGGVVYAAFDTCEEAGRIAATSPSNYQSVVAKGCNHSPLHVAMSL